MSTPLLTTTKSTGLPWQVVEKAIDKEIIWLKKIIQENPYPEKNQFAGLCKNCIYRRMAVLIVSGKVKTKEIKSTICLWGNKKSSKIKKPHGGKWHAEMISLVAGYFESLKYEVVIEPNLFWGRADLGVYKKNKRPLLVEIGTTSLPKLLLNLQSMEGSTLLLIINSNHAVEFSILEAAQKSVANFIR